MATNLEVNKENIVKITKAARTRWRIENQCFNTLKNFRYELLGMFKLFIFESWEHMLIHCLDNNGVDPPEIV
jgi:hypothetical protein